MARIIATIPPKRGNLDVNNAMSNRKPPPIIPGKSIWGEKCLDVNSAIKARRVNENAAAYISFRPFLRLTILCSRLMPIIFFFKPGWLICLIILRYMLLSMFNISAYRLGSHDNLFLPLFLPFVYPLSFSEIYGYTFDVGLDREGSWF